MTQRTLGMIMNGVTGRMGMNQHLIRSVAAIRAQGGVSLSDGSKVQLDPILVGRNAEKIEALAKAHGIERWTTDLDAAIADPEDEIFFDAATTQMRPTLLEQAIKAGKHIYCEKPIATNLAGGAADLSGSAEEKRHQERRRAGQAVPARPAEAEDAARFRLLRPHALRARRVRLLGVRGRLGPAGAASVLELPRRGRRRHHSRHGLPLALRARQSFRRGEIGLLHRRDAYSRARGRDGQALSGDRRRCGLCDLQARWRRDRQHQHVLVHARLS